MTTPTVCKPLAAGVDIRHSTANSPKGQLAEPSSKPVPEKNPLPPVFAAFIFIGPLSICNGPQALFRCFAVYLSVDYWAGGKRGGGPRRRCPRDTTGLLPAIAGVIHPTSQPLRGLPCTRGASIGLLKSSRAPLPFTAAKSLIIFQFAPGTIAQNAADRSRHRLLGWC